MIKKNTILLLLAVVLVGLGVGSTVYLHAFDASQESEIVLVAEQKFILDHLFRTLELRRVREYQGIPLDVIIKQAGVKNPQEQSYTLIAADGYRKTVKWEEIEQGLLTREQRAVLPSLPKQCWMKNLLKIEVIK